MSLLRFCFRPPEHCERRKADLDHLAQPMCRGVKGVFRVPDKHIAAQTVRLPCKASVEQFLGCDRQRLERVSGIVSEEHIRARREARQEINLIVF